MVCTGNIHLVVALLSLKYWINILVPDPLRQLVYTRWECVTKDILGTSNSTSLHRHIYYEMFGLYILFQTETALPNSREFFVELRSCSFFGERGGRKFISTDSQSVNI